MAAASFGEFGDSKEDWLSYTERMQQYFLIKRIGLLNACESASALLTRATVYLSSSTRMEECAQLLHKGLALRERVIYKYNTDLTETHDCLAQAYSRMGEFVLATEHCRRSVEAVEVVYGEDSIELAQELHKLAQLLFNYPDCFCTDAVVHFL